MLNPGPQPPSPWPAQDWDALFDAVRSRLRSSAESCHEAADAAHNRDWLRGQVLDCVAALTQLHAQVAQERAAQKRMARELEQVEEALARARQELGTTRAGERRALHQARHDGLTQLPNREHFHQRLSDALAQSLPGLPSPSHPQLQLHLQALPAAPGSALAVLYLDLDGLKPINDQHGHQAGDQLLRIVASRLSRAVRREDMVCRMGGDEFACLLTQALSREQLSHLACKLFDAVSAPLKIGALELTVRPSIGIAVCPADGATADGLLRNADSAMYHAKRRQLGYAFFEPGHDGAAQASNVRPMNGVTPRPPSG